MTNEKRMPIMAVAAALAVLAAAAPAAQDVLRSPSDRGSGQPMLRQRALRSPLRRSFVDTGRAAAQSAGAVSPNAVAEASAAGDGESAGASDLNFKDAPGDMVFEIYGKLVDRTVLKDPQTPTVTITLQSLPGQKLSKEDQISAIETVLEMNGIPIQCSDEELVRIGLSMADGSMAYDALYQWVMDHKR